MVIDQILLGFLIIVTLVLLVMLFQFFKAVNREIRKKDAPPQAKKSEPSKSPMVQDPETE
jgi:hypothetical protein